ncbi:MAG TPA: hypothetical protein VLH37_02155 [Bacteroidales bacterium]|nr:hypothetical protein [Bacteroidales bacterium]
MKRKSLSLLCVVALVLGFSSCQKEDTMDQKIALAEDEAISDSYFSQAIAETDDLGDVAMVFENLPVDITAKTAGTSPVAPPVSGSRVVTVTPEVGFPKTITITFTDWKVGERPAKNGVIQIVITGPMHRAGTSRTITFQNFTIGGNLMEGTKTITNVDGITVTITLRGGKITFQDGTFITREVSRTRKWIAGILTPRFIWDDEFQIEGTVSGVNRRGEQYSVVITKPLIRRMACLWLVEGTVTIRRGDRSLVLDYGNGTCDDLATITANGETREITLPRTPPRRR